MDAKWEIAKEEARVTLGYRHGRLFKFYASFVLSNLPHTSITQYVQRDIYHLLNNNMLSYQLHVLMSIISPNSRL